MQRRGGDPRRCARRALWGWICSPLPLMRKNARLTGQRRARRDHAQPSSPPPRVQHSSPGIHITLSDAAWVPCRPLGGAISRSRAPRTARQPARGQSAALQGSHSSRSSQHSGAASGMRGAAPLKASSTCHSRSARAAQRPGVGCAWCLRPGLLRARLRVLPPPPPTLVPRAPRTPCAGPRERAVHQQQVPLRHRARAQW